MVHPNPCPNITGTLNAYTAATRDTQNIPSGEETRSNPEGPPEIPGTSSGEETRSNPEGPPETPGTSLGEETRSNPEGPPETPRTSSGEETRSNPEGSPETPRTSSGEETRSNPEGSPSTTSRTCWPLNLRLNPEAKKELEEVEKFYTTENSLRRSMPLEMETWRKVKIHMLSE